MLRLERSFERAVLLSLVAHGLLLWTYRLPTLQPNMAGTIAVTLGKTEVASGQVIRQDVLANTKSLGPRSPMPLNKQHQLLAADNGASSVALQALAPTKSVLTNPTVPTPSTTAPASNATGTGQSAAQPASADSLRDYRLQLARQARRFKSYPPLARQRGQEGVVELLLTHPLALGGVQVQLKRGSGHTLLDEQAMEMLERAVRLVELPAGLTDKVFQMSLSIEYRLEED